MLVLLPPSETKRDGGSGAPLELSGLAFPRLVAARRQTIAELRRVSSNRLVAAKVLGLSAGQADEIERNRLLGKSATMPAIERYTGVLYDGLDVASLPARARDFLAATTVVHSALFGFLRANDEIPAYRLSATSTLPGKSLRSIWLEPLSRELADHSGLIVDLRSESYAKLGALPAREGAVFIRVVTEDEGGARRALNHFNKKAKGEFVRRLALDSPECESLAGLREWSAASGFRLTDGEPGELNLVVT